MDLPISTVSTWAKVFEIMTMIQLISLIPRSCLMVGSSFYILYCCQLLHVSSIVVYGASVLLGAGAAIIWTSQGFILACNSCERTIQRYDLIGNGFMGENFKFRNCGLFWSIFHLSGVIGNLFVFLIIQSSEGFDRRTRSLVRYSI